MGREASITSWLGNFNKGCGTSFTKGFCKELVESMFAKLWWGHCGEENRIHWASWKHKCESKMVGGIGFRNLELFNLSLLTKQGWQLMQNSDSLFYDVFKVKYFLKTTFLKSQLGKNHSYAWRSIFATKDILLQGCIGWVGTGKNINLWEDRWVQANLKPFSGLPTLVYLWMLWLIC